MLFILHFFLQFYQLIYKKFYKKKRILYNFYMDFIKSTEKGSILVRKLIPNSSQDKIIGYGDNFLKIKITAPPNVNKANKHLIEYISKIFGVAKTKISIISG